MNHKHEHCCEHNEVKYCKVCKVVYCTKCGKEWQEYYNWTYTNSGTYKIIDPLPYVVTCDNTSSNEIKPNVHIH